MSTSNHDSEREEELVSSNTNESYVSSPSSPEPDDRLLASYLDAQQLPGETLLTFYHRLQGMRDLAYCERDNCPEDHAVYHFIQGIRDRKVVLYVLDWKPLSLSAALTIAQGRAAQILAETGYNHLTKEEYGQLTNREMARLIEDRTPDILRFKRTKQRTRESVSAYFERFQFFATRAYPVWDSMKDRSLFADFIHGLEDFRVRQALLKEKNLLTFPDLVRTAQEESQLTTGAAAEQELTRAREQLNQAKQERDETILAYYERLHELLPLAYPSLGALQYTPLVGKFIGGLRDSRIRNYLMEMDPLDQTSALAAAQARQAALAFEGTHQRPGETVLSYHGRLINLFTRAWPSYPPGGSWLASSFLSGLAEPQVRVRAQGREPQDYRATLLHAHRHEAHLYYLDKTGPHPVRDAYWTPHPDQVRRVRHHVYQEPGESLLSYHERLPQLVIDSFPVERVDDQMLTCKFIIGLRDGRIKTYILQHRTGGYPNYLQAFDLANTCRKELTTESETN
jgi:hypothetical protein